MVVYVTLHIRRLCNMPTFSIKGGGKGSIDTCYLECVVLHDFRFLQYAYITSVTEPHTCVQMKALLP